MLSVIMLNIVAPFIYQCTF